MLEALAFIAIVNGDQVALRAAPRESAPQQAVMWGGDALEIRGEKGDYLRVWDHRRERGGYVRAAQVRRQSLAPERAGELLAVVRFLRETPEAESLGIAYAAAFLKAAPAAAIDGEVFDALGTMAERLARRASMAKRKGNGAALAGHLETAAAYGVNMLSFERDGRVRLCYDGEAFRRVMALPSTETQRARAALALTRHDCLSPELRPVERVATDKWRAEVLDRVVTRDLPEVLKNRMRLRQAGVWAAIAQQRAQQRIQLDALGDEATAGGTRETAAVRGAHGTAAGGGREKAAVPGAHAMANGGARDAAERALRELAAVNKSELTEDDQAAYADAAIRVGASRWAAEALPAASRKLAIVTTPGDPGETCVHLVDAKHDAKAPLLTRCTYGVVWAVSASAQPQGKALALAVQPLAAWRELWVFRQDGDGWRVDVMPPASDPAAVGYVEFAGWVPGGKKLLAAREARVDGRFKQSFEVVDLGSLKVEKQADRPSSLSVFYRWQDPKWKGGTVALR